MSSRAVRWDPEGLAAAAADVSRLAAAVGDLHAYATADGLGPAHFGDLDGAPAAWQAFSAAVGRLAASVDTAHTHLQDVADRVTSAAAATTAADEDAARNFRAAGPGE